FYKGQDREGRYEQFINDICQTICTNGGFVTRSHALEVVLPVHSLERDFVNRCRDALEQTKHMLPEVYEKALEDTEKRFENDGRDYVRPSSVLKNIGILRGVVEYGHDR